jgi:hypothetical protein
MVAPAISPTFDLSAALSRVRSRAYVFHSSIDPVCGWGTRNFGTIDRQYTESAGKDGFDVRDVPEYRKLVQFPYDRSWMRAGHAGDHIGGMMKPFARRVIAPLLMTGELPRIEPASPARATTRPSAAASPAGAR